MRTVTKTYTEVEGNAPAFAGVNTSEVGPLVSTIQDMDQLLVLHKGKLRELGTHQELLAKRGIYFKLFELQYAAREPAAK